ncbi:hypothetical protein DPMN_146577 [Dreissena polymorpha]|uniref:Uncharacterized protein n=1 Tax=Dreissena polymorpha TaxID=45954 RepID=A0A9D4F6U1_DREPO|nr:hypothetical protein DPMN_146577 [Dreissena polymorpha]
MMIVMLVLLLLIRRMLLLLYLPLMLVILLTMKMKNENTMISHFVVILFVDEDVTCGGVDVYEDYANINKPVMEEKILITLICVGVAVVTALVLYDTIRRIAGVPYRKPSKDHRPALSDGYSETADSVKFKNAPRPRTQ